MFRRPDGTWTLSDREMNKFAMALYEASGSYDNKGCSSLGREMYALWNKITDVLQECGYYD